MPRSAQPIVQPLAPPHDAIAMSGFGLWNGVDGCEFRSHRGFDGLLQPGTPNERPRHGSGFTTRSSSSIAKRLTGKFTEQRFIVGCQ